MIYIINIKKKINNKNKQFYLNSLVCSLFNFLFNNINLFLIIKYIKN